jgi:hypothetical protein
VRQAAERLPAPDARRWLSAFRYNGAAMQRQAASEPQAEEALRAYLGLALTEHVGAHVWVSRSLGLSQRGAARQGPL